MTPRRKYSYALLREILAEQPRLEQRSAELAREYASRHPNGQQIKLDSLRDLLRKHGPEILGREYRPGPTGRPPGYDVNLIRSILAEDPERIHHPSMVARLYRKHSGRRIGDKHMGYILRGRKDELLSDLGSGKPFPGNGLPPLTPVESLTEVSQGDELSPQSEDAVNRFAEIMRLARKLDSREHDVLHLGEMAYYADVLADGIHWALLHGIQPTKAFYSAWDTVRLERKYG